MAAMVTTSEEQPKVIEINLSKYPIFPRMSTKPVDPLMPPAVLADFSCKVHSGAET
jgi:hypothetical protein